MAITITEIQAVLSLKNQLAPQFSAAVADVRAQAAALSGAVAGAGDGFAALGSSAQRSIGTVSAELLLAQQKVADLHRLVLENADKKGFVAGLAAEMDEAIPQVEALKAELAGLTKQTDAHAAATKGASGAGSAFGGMLQQVTGLLGAFGIATSAAALVGFVKDAIEGAARLDELSRATGISTTGLQQFKYVGIEAGVGMEQFARGVETLSARLATGDKSATKAVQELGLSVADLIAAGPQEAFIQIADAASRVENPMVKGGIAAELFGARLGKQLIPMLGDLREKMNAVPQGSIISEENIKQAKAFDDRLQQTKISLEAFVVSMFGAAANLPKAFGIIDAAARRTSFGQIPATGFVGPQEPIGGLKLNIDQGTLDFFKKGTTAADLLNNRLKALRAEALEPLNATQRAAIVELKAFGESETDIAQLIGSNEIAVHRYIEAQTKAAAAGKTFAESERNIEDLMAGTSWDWSIDGALRLGASVTDVARVFGVSVGEVKRHEQALKDQIETLKLTAKAVHEVETQTKTSWDKITVLLGNPVPSSLREELAKLDRDGLPNFMTGLDKVGQKSTFTREQLRELLGPLAVLLDALDKSKKAGTEFLGGISPQLRQIIDDAKAAGTPFNDLVEALKKMGMTAAQAYDAVGLGALNAVAGVQALTKSFSEAAQIMGDSFKGAEKMIGSVLAGVNQIATAYKAAAEEAAKMGGTPAQVSQAGMSAGVTAGMTFGMTTLISLLGDAQNKADALQAAIADLKFNAAAHFAELTRAMGQYAQSYIDAINNAYTLKDANDAINAMQHQLDLHTEAVAKFGPSQNDLQDLADRSKEVWQQMQQNGGFTAAQIEKAFEAMVAAERRALTDTKQGAMSAADAAAKEAQGVMDQAAAAGYQTQAQLQQTADAAQALAVAMRDSNLFTAAEVADAFDKAAKARDAAMGLDSKAIDDMKAKYKSLSDSVSQEAPEEVMGVIETQMRGQMAALDEQIKAASATAQQSHTDAADAAAADATATFKASGDDYTKYVDTKYQDAMLATVKGSKDAADQTTKNFSDAADAAALAIAARFQDMRIVIPIDFDVHDPNLPGPGPRGMAAGGSGMTTGPTWFYSAGNERYWFGGEGNTQATPRAGGGGSPDDIVRLLARIDQRLGQQMDNLPVLIRDAVLLSGTV